MCKLGLKLQTDEYGKGYSPSTKYSEGLLDFLLLMTESIFNMNDSGVELRPLTVYELQKGINPLIMSF